MPGTYKLKLSGNVLRQSCINIWHYTSVTGSPIAKDLHDIFTLAVLPSIAAIASSEVTYTDLEVVNIGNPLDYFISAFSVAGTRSGICSSPFNAWGFKLLTSSLSAKAGGKRFAGVSASDLVDGDPSGAIMSALGTCALNIGRALVSGSGNFRPVLVSIRCNKDPVTHRCNGTFQATTYPQIQSGLWDVTTTQSSRKWRTSP